MKGYIFLANGYEEVEALATADVLRRGGVEIALVSMQESREAKGSHGICVLADSTFKEGAYEDADVLILPGGMPGTKTLDGHKGLAEVIKSQFNKGKLVAAICAAPSVLGHLGILKGRKATCFPGFEKELGGAEFVDRPAVIDGNVVTGKSMGTAVDFGLAVYAKLCGEDKASELEKRLVRK